MKRAYCLYRVSTKKQVDKREDDIPMQKIDCQRFAESKGWTIVKELSEKGVSGYKVSVNDRDEMQTIKAHAEQGKLDILLVWHSDRLGRIESETPFLVEWFVQQGIAVWSVKEGELKTDTHTDKLINYIRFWQSSGESQKISMRIKTRREQMTAAGIVCGGVAPYGYVFTNCGRVNKKGDAVKDLVIDPQEALVVREVFERTIAEGIGSYTMARELNERGLRTHNGAKFQCNTILRMLERLLYAGVLDADSTPLVVREDLRIVDSALFGQAGRIAEQRKGKNESKRTVAKQTKGKVLLSGNIYCGHCGARLNSIRYQDSYTRKDGSEYRIDEPKYQCSHKARERSNCSGQHHYKASTIDEIVSSYAAAVLAQIKITPKDASIEARIGARVALLTKAKTAAVRTVAQRQAELDRLEQEVVLCLMGKSKFTEETLGRQIDRAKAAIEESQNEHDRIVEELDDQTMTQAGIGGLYEQFISWADEFEHADIARKKMILCELFPHIELCRGYDVSITVNPDYAQFLAEAEKQFKQAG